MQNPIHYPTMATVKNAAVRFNVTPTYVCGSLLRKEGHHG